MVISMLVKSMYNNSKGAVAMMGCIGTLGMSAFVFDALPAAVNCLFHLHGHFRPPELVM